MGMKEKFKRMDPQKKLTYKVAGAGAMVIAACGYGVAEGIMTNSVITIVFSAVGAGAMTLMSDPWRTWPVAIKDGIHGLKNLLRGEKKYW